ncbi:ankyrin-1-like [Trichogramma pretiosum]|uniref:ankyrin-1-like n=1 Tax=Trichogramma pretiosum TaxID=7493 RepID=UPI0006C97174|nr:ankyrin-1-like [Trichogramma pretiosum]
MAWYEYDDAFRVEIEYSRYAVKPFLELGQDPNCLEQKSDASSVDLGVDPNLVNENGVTPLHCICDIDDDNEDLAKMLFEISHRKLQSVKVNTVDNSGRTPLHYALRKGCKKRIVEILLKNDADPNVADVDGSTLLHILCNRSRYWDKNETLSELLFLIKDGTHQPLQVDAQDKWGRTPLHLALIQNQEDDPTLAETRQNPNLANAKESTSLHTICERCYDDDIIKMFFEINDERHEMVQVDARDNLEGYDVLHMLFRLTDDKYQPLQVNAQDKLGDTPLLLHLNLDSHWYRDRTEYLLRNDADPNLANADGLTCLHIICKKNYYHDDQMMIKTLFELSNEKYQPLLIDAQDNLGNTPLHYAVAESFEEQTVRVLLESGTIRIWQCGGIDIMSQKAKKLRDDKNNLEMFFKIGKDFRQKLQVNSQDKLGNTALHLAVGLDDGCKNLVELLLQNGANPNLPNKYDLTPVHDKRGQTPLHYALPQGYNKETVQVLLKNGANPNQVDVEGLTLLHILCNNGRDFGKNDVDLSDLVLMIKDGTHQPLKVDTIDKYGRTPLYYALLQSYNKRIVQVLLKNGANPNQVDGEGSTLLHVLCNSDRFFDVDLSNLFLRIKDGTLRSLKVDAIDKYGRTPLYLALINENIEVAESLMRNGVNLNLANAEGMAILSIICKRHQDDFLKELFEICGRYIQQTVQVDTPDELGRTPLQ